jgi:DNA-binding PadR family transcriptional regulator
VSITLSYAAASILLAISNGYEYGFDIMDCTGLPSGTVYPALRRLEECKLVSSQWEEQENVTQRPPRKYYTISRNGEAALETALRRYPLLERVAPNVPQKQRE